MSTQKPDVIQSPAAETSKYLLQDDAAEEVYNQRSTGVKIVFGLMYGCAAFVALLVFLIAVKFVGDGFALVLGCNMKDAFDFADNPITGLMIGVVTTSLLQSSSTVTSIAVALVGAGAFSLRDAIPLVMGANIGTCVTSTFVAFGHVGNRVEFERAMAAGTVHDIFNIMNVLVLMPLELALHPLEKLSIEMSGAKAGSGMFQSPIDKIIKPISKEFVEVDKKAQNAVTTGNKTCKPGQSFYKSGMFKKSGMSDDAIGAILIAMGVVVLIIALYALVKMLSGLFLGSTKKIVNKVLSFNGYLSILFGFGMTFVVQSSSLTTSTFTPLAGLGVISLEQMYPIVLGANVGTTATAMIASLATGKNDALALAFVHLWFNVVGILIWYPIPFMRNFICNMARKLANWSASWRMVAVGFLLLVIVITPGVLLGLSALATSGSSGVQVFGWILIALFAGGLLVFLFWFNVKGGVEKWEEFLSAKRAEAVAKDGVVADESVERHV